jgi:HEAT repeat protein
MPDRTKEEIERLINILTNDNEGEIERFAASDALYELGDTAVLPLIKLLKEAAQEVNGDVDNEPLLSELASALSACPTAVVPLIELLNHENDNVRYEAVWILGEIGDTRAVEPLTELLEDEVVEAEDALEKIKNPEAWR